MTEEKLIEEILHEAYRLGIYEDVIKEVSYNNPNKRPDFQTWEKILNPF